MWLTFGVGVKEDIRYGNDDDMAPILQEKLKGDKIHFTISLDFNGTSKIKQTDQSNRTKLLPWPYF